MPRYRETGTLNSRSHRSFIVIPRRYQWSASRLRGPTLTLACDLFPFLSLSLSGEADSSPVPSLSKASGDIDRVTWIRKSTSGFSWRNRGSWIFMLCTEVVWKSRVTSQISAGWIRHRMMKPRPVSWPNPDFGPGACTSFLRGTKRRMR